MLDAFLVGLFVQIFSVLAAPGLGAPPDQAAASRLAGHRSAAAAATANEPVILTRRKRSVEAFVREEVNSLDQSDLFLDSFLTHQFSPEYPVAGSDLLEAERMAEEAGRRTGEAREEVVVMQDEADSTFLPPPPQAARHRIPRSVGSSADNEEEEVEVTPELLQKIKVLANDPHLRTWVETAGSNLLNKLNAFANKTDSQAGQTNKTKVTEITSNGLDDGGKGAKVDRDGSPVVVSQSDLRMSKEDLVLIRFLIDMLNQGEKEKKAERKAVDPTCLNVEDILANDTMEVVRRKQGKRMSCYMDKSIDPCEDFYEYACGNWDQYYPIPMDRGGYDTFEILREQLDLKLRNLLQAEITEKDSGATEAVKTLYSSCMNTDEIERRGEVPLLSLLDQLGGWPVLNQSWDPNQFNWIKLIGELRLFNNDILVSLWVGPDGKNSDQYIVQFDQSDLVLPSLEYYHQGINHPIINAYKNILMAVAVLLGADKVQAEKQMRDIIDFEIKLSKIMTPPHERRYFSQMYEKMELSQLSALVPNFNFTQYLDIVLPETVKPNDKIVIYASRYFIKLTELVEETDKRTLANYILMRFIRHRINNLDKRFEKIQNELYRLLYGREEMPARWKFCIAYVNGNLGMAVGALFVNKYFDGQSKQDMLNLTQEVQQQFRYLLENSDWLSPSTKKTATMKLDAMIHNIGYPQLVVDKDLLQEEIKGINFTSNEFFENVLENLKGRTQKEMSMLGQRVNRSIWTTTPAVVNAYYSRNRNQIMFPAGILQPPFYHKFFPKSMNYGGIGVVIGHEITHGFDDKGKQFDNLGNINQWWDNTSSSNFIDKAQCIIDQYGSFEVTEVGTNLNGLNTQGENIADNGGIKQAYRAFRKWQDSELTEDRLSHLQDMSADQLFFLNFAQVWCGTARPEALRSKLKTAVHAPGKYRVLGTLANSADFHRVFDCKPGSKMNPVDQCRVW